VRRAEAVLGKPWDPLLAAVFLDFKRNGIRSHYENLYFTRRIRLNDLVLGECAEGKGRFLDEITNGVWLVCEESFWGFPAHLAMQKAGIGLPDVSEPIVDLFAADTGENLSWIHYLVGAQLETVSPLIPRRIELEAKRRILNPTFERDDFWWMWRGIGSPVPRLNNWNAWINSNLIVTNLLLEKDAERRIQALTKICRSVDKYLEEYSPDAGCEEGPGYWALSAGSFFDCCQLLASATGGAGNVLTHPFVRRMAHFIADVHIADDYYVNYADARAKSGPPPDLLYRMGTGVQDQALAAFGAFLSPLGKVPMAEGLRSADPRYCDTSLSRLLPDIINAANLRTTPKIEALERDAWYPSLKLMTARARANSTDGFYLAVQVAQNARSHGHNDSGSFIVFHDGLPVFVDVGPEAYNALTFSAARYTIWVNQSAFHNLPTVGGVMQSAAKQSYRASEVRYSCDDAHAGIEMNLATAYPDEAGIKRWMRSMVLDRKAERITLVEEFALQRKVPVALSFMTPRTPAHGPQGGVVLSVAGGSARDVALRFDESQMAATFEKIDLKDEWLRPAWGDCIYRVLLTSTQPVDSGKWTIEML
jgi:hypothetical protein